MDVLNRRGRILAVHVEDTNTQCPIQCPCLLTGGIELDVTQARLDGFIRGFGAEGDFEGLSPQAV